MNGDSIELRVGGHTYRVSSSATADQLHRLAQVVDDKLRELGPTTAFHPQSMLLVAISLAHELEQERTKRQSVERRSRQMLSELLQRVDAALELTEPEDGRASEPSDENRPPATT